ncbi:MAG: magnesium transporter [Actinomycetota bacterium]|jgi:magnesium transporter
MTITVHCYNDLEVKKAVDPHDISELIHRDNNLIWVDLVDPDDADFAHVQEEFELHPLAIEDAREHGQRPKLEQYPTHAFIVAYSKQQAEVDLFVGKDWLVSVRERSEAGDVWDLAPVQARFDRTKPDSVTVGFLLYTVLDELVDGYFDHTDEVEEHLEKVEEGIFAERVRAEMDVQQELFDVRRRLLQFRRRVVPLREVVSALLRREVEWIDDATMVHLQDVYDHVLRVIDLVDSHRELLGNAVDAHLAIISNRMNEVMKKMTSWGAILLGSTLVAGIYGMNFRHMPELRWQYGYPYALGLMALITIVGYRFFRKKDWL